MVYIVYIPRFWFKLRFQTFQCPGVVKMMCMLQFLCDPRNSLRFLWLQCVSGCALRRWKLRSAPAIGKDSKHPTLMGLLGCFPYYPYFLEAKCHVWSHDIPKRLGQARSKLAFSPRLLKPGWATWSSGSKVKIVQWKWKWNDKWNESLDYNHIVLLSYHLLCHVSYIHQVCFNSSGFHMFLPPIRGFFETLGQAASLVRGQLLRGSSLKASFQHWHDTWHSYYHVISDHIGNTYHVMSYSLFVIYLHWYCLDLVVNCLCC